MTGRCICGSVEFEIAGDVTKLYQCHCSLCRKQGGSSSNTATLVQQDSFRWLAGENNISRYRKETGFSSFFCATCGCPVPNPLRDTELVWIPAGALEDSANMEIVMHIYTGSRAGWDRIPESGQHFEEMPDIDSFYRLLQAQD